MSKRNARLCEVDDNLIKIMDRVSLNKIRLRQNDTKLSRRRLTLAIAKIPNLENVLMKAKIVDEK